MEPNQDKKSNGALIGSIIVILIIILGGVYFWTSKQKVEAPTDQNTNGQAAEETNTNTTEFNSIEAELEAGAAVDTEFDVSNIQ